MRLYEVRAEVNHITNGSVQKALHKLIDALEEAGVDAALKDKEMAESMRLRTRDVLQKKEQVELAALAAENKYVMDNLSDDNEVKEEDATEEGSSE